MPRYNQNKYLDGDKEYRTVKQLYFFLSVFPLAACEQVSDVADNTQSCASIEDETFIEISPPNTTGLSNFFISQTEITNGQFALFIQKTGYVTDAEKKATGNALHENQGGGAVFMAPEEFGQYWWQYAPEANWTSPDGEDSSIHGQDKYPVVQVSYNDAETYAKWAGGRLPTEAEWEYAAGAGATTRYAWGNEKTVDGKEQANTWQGMFPLQNTNQDGFLTRAPVGCFPPNKTGLYDAIGNVWEWTASPYGDPRQHSNIIKGGSFLCADNYCQNYTVPAQEKHETNFSANHIGFRIVKDALSN